MKLNWKKAESFLVSTGLAVKSLKTNLLRTSLSLLGVTIGIFAVSSIYTGVDSLNNFLLKSLDKFGNNTLFIDRINYEKIGQMDWTEIRKNRPVSYEEYQYLKEKLPARLYKDIGYRFSVPRVAAKHGKQKVRVTLIGDTYEVYGIMDFNIESGRFFNKFEVLKGIPVAVIGGNVADALFPGQNPLGKDILILGKKVKVIGVLKKETGAIKINPTDNQIFVPVNFLLKFYPADKRMNSVIVVLPSDINKIEPLKEQITILLRKYRKLKPGQKNTFYVNNISFLKDMVQKSMDVLKTAGWILGGFSLLVGAFGIANIMFVTVKERTREIGIQKALGASGRLILIEFLVESILLSLIGGLVGFLLLYLGVRIANKIFHDFEIIISLKNILIVSIISILIGVLAGIFPALKASKLHPIDAIRKE